MTPSRRVRASLLERCGPTPTRYIVSRYAEEM